MTENKRLDDHFALGDSYLVQAVTDAVGNYFAKSIDSSALGTIKGTVTADGEYSVDMVDSKGVRNSSTSGGIKTKAENETKTVAGHKDSGVGGGARETDKKGKHKESDGAETGAVNGPSAKTTAQSAKTFAQGGNGPQRIKGDYTLSSEEGGLHFETAKDFTVSAKTTISLGSNGGELSLNAKGGNIGITTQDGKTTIDTNGKTRIFSTSDINIISNASITLTVGSSYISITPSGITIKASRVDINP